MLAEMSFGRFAVLTLALCAGSFVVVHYAMQDAAKTLAPAPQIAEAPPPSPPFVSGPTLLVDHSKYVGKRVTVRGVPYGANQWHVALRLGGAEATLKNSEPETERALLECHSEAPACPAMTFEATVSNLDAGRYINLTGARLVK